MWFILMVTSLLCGISIAENCSAPGQVQNITVNSNTPKELYASWELPEGSTSCIKYYQVCWNPKTNTTASKCGNTKNGNDIIYHITGLDACTEYSINVISVVNTSDTSKPVSATGLTAPGPVKNVAVHSGNLKSLHVSWDLPDGTNDCIKNYQVCWNLKTKPVVADKCSSTKSGNDTDFDISDLANCTDYTVSVKSVVNLSTSTNSTTVPGTGHTGPGLVSGIADSLNKSSLNVMWQPPKDSAQCTLDHYTVCWSELTGGTKKCGNTTDKQSMVTYNIIGLEECVDYAIEVSYQEKVQVNYSTTIIAYRGPAFVNNLQASATMAEQLAVTWSAPNITSTSACTLNNYTYIVAWVNMGNLTDKGSATTTNNSYTIENLSSCTEYNVQVAAQVLKDGLSQATNVRKSTGPALVSGITAANVDNTISLTWDQLANDTKCNIDHYHICWAKITDQRNATCKDLEGIKNTTFKITGDLEDCVDYAIDVSVQVKLASFNYKNRVITNRAPGAVQDLTAESTGIGKLHISWTAPNTTKYCTLNNFMYSVCWSDVLNVKYDCMNTTGTAVDIGTLFTCTTYVIPVYAQTVLGNLPIPTSITKITAPSNPEFMSSDDMSITSNWASDSHCSGNYTICIHDVEHKNPELCTYVGNSTRHKFDNLSKCTNYTEILYTTTQDGQITPNSTIDLRTTCSGNSLSTCWEMFFLIMSVLCLYFILYFN